MIIKSKVLIAKVVFFFYIPLFLSFDLMASQYTNKQSLVNDPSFELRNDFELYNSSQDIDHLRYTHHSEDIIFGDTSLLGVLPPYHDLNVKFNPDWNSGTYLDSASVELFAKIVNNKQSNIEVCTFVYYQTGIKDKICQKTLTGEAVEKFSVNVDADNTREVDRVWIRIENRSSQTVELAVDSVNVELFHKVEQRFEPFLPPPLPDAMQQITFNSFDLTLEGFSHDSTNHDLVLDPTGFDGNGGLSFEVNSYDSVRYVYQNQWNTGNAIESALTYFQILQTSEGVSQETEACLFVYFQNGNSSKTCDTILNSNTMLPALLELTSQTAQENRDALVDRVIVRFKNHSNSPVNISIDNFFLGAIAYQDEEQPPEDDVSTPPIDDTLSTLLLTTFDNDQLHLTHSSASDVFEVQRPGLDGNGSLRVNLSPYKSVRFIHQYEWNTGTFGDFASFFGAVQQLNENYSGYIESCLFVYYQSSPTVKVCNNIGEYLNGNIEDFLIDTGDLLHQDDEINRVIIRLKNIGNSLAELFLDDIYVGLRLTDESDETPPDDPIEPIDPVDPPVVRDISISTPLEGETISGTVSLQTTLSGLATDQFRITLNSIEVASGSVSDGSQTFDIDTQSFNEGIATFDITIRSDGDVVKQLQRSVFINNVSDELPLPAPNWQNYRVSANDVSPALQGEMVNDYTKSVRVVLHPSHDVDGDETVVFGFPLPPGVLGNVDHVSVLNSDGEEVPAMVTSLGNWKYMPHEDTLCSGLTGLGSPGIRSIAIQLDTTFAQNASQEIFVVLNQTAQQDYDGEAVAFADQLVNIENGPLYQQEMQFDYGQQSETLSPKEPEVYALIDNNYLRCAQLATMVSPVSEFALNTSDIAQKNFFYSSINEFLGTELTGEVTAEKYKVRLQNTSNSAWLYDRMMTMLNAYMVHGDFEMYREFIRSTLLYQQLLYKSGDCPEGRDCEGYFKLKNTKPEAYYKDSKYSYGESVAAFYWLTGDVHAFSSLTDVTKASVDETDLIKNKGFYYTERHTGIALITAIADWETTGDSELRKYIEKSVDDLITRRYTQPYQPQSFIDAGTTIAANGCLITNYDRIGEPGIDPWKASLLTHGLFRYYSVFKDQRVANVLAEQARCIIEHATSMSSHRSDIDSTRTPFYSASTTLDVYPNFFDSEGNPWSGQEHALDVAYLTAVGAFLEQDPIMKQDLIDNTLELIDTHNLIINDYTRDGARLTPGYPVYRTWPFRKYAWQYKNVGSISWLIGENSSVY
ncbi:hypothetical protein [Alteromonas oceanisediminis]|uniref:hypothetical protein n=1 Tax=Alteromonas oceanisediminis TaxID=2836180 RepID=UPI001BDB0CFC|nr:hypothetical protein [Alteromonas oceanisediminis]MBT0587089.1 hypothetical protein [Alteromonas oceanisediminis]